MFERPQREEERSPKLQALNDRSGRVPANDQASMNVSFYQEQTFIR